MKIHLGDQVQVIIGKDKGRAGQVAQVIAKQSAVVVKGLNLYKKHFKATKQNQGGILEKERPLAISKVALVCPSCKKITRVGYLIDKNGQKTRICKKCQAALPVVKI